MKNFILSECPRWLIWLNWLISQGYRSGKKPCQVKYHVIPIACQYSQVTSP